jgi:hypothetical protein
LGENLLGFAEREPVSQSTDFETEGNRFAFLRWSAAKFRPCFGGRKG